MLQQNDYFLFRFDFFTARYWCPKEIVLSYSIKKIKKMKLLLKHFRKGYLYSGWNFLGLLAKRPLYLESAAYMPQCWNMAHLHLTWRKNSISGWPLKIHNDFLAFFRDFFRGFSRFFQVVSINRIVIWSPVIFSWLLTQTNQHHSYQ